VVFIFPNVLFFFIIIIIIIKIFFKVIIRGQVHIRYAMRERKRHDKTRTHNQQGSRPKVKDRKEAMQKTGKAQDISTDRWRKDDQRKEGLSQRIPHANGKVNDDDTRETCHKEEVVPE